MHLFFLPSVVDLMGITPFGQIKIGASGNHNGIIGDVGSGLYPVAHRVICYCGKIKVPQSGNSQVSNGVPVSLFTRLVSTC